MSPTGGFPALILANGLVGGLGAAWGLIRRFETDPNAGPGREAANAITHHSLDFMNDRSAHAGDLPRGTLCDQG
jgi:hypothetical protein